MKVGSLTLQRSQICVVKRCSFGVVRRVHSMRIFNSYLVCALAINWDKDFMTE